MAEEKKTPTPPAPAPASATGGTPAPGADPAAAEAAPGQPTAAELLNVDIAAGQKVVRAKGAKNITSGVVHVLATFNNTIVSVTDPAGNVIGWSSAGKMGYKGSRKSTAYAAQLVSQDACRQAMGHGLREAWVEVKGPGAGRESAVRAVQAMGIEILSIRDVTPIPHNGCRPPKARRV
jgi:small subunit ribosomal protein S11